MKTIQEEDGLKEKSKGKTKEGATELLTMGDLQSHRKMFNLLKNTFPDITVSVYKIESFLRFFFVREESSFIICFFSIQCRSTFSVHECLFPGIQ